MARAAITRSGRSVFCVRAPTALRLAVARVSETRFAEKVGTAVGGRPLRPALAHRRASKLTLEVVRVRESSADQSGKNGCPRCAKVRRTFVQLLEDASILANWGRRFLNGTGV